MEDEFRSLILLGDVDELLREVDRRADQRDWAGLHRLRAACEAAVDTGHQLWPVTSWISYVLVLRGDHADVIEMLSADQPVFTFGPLTEVAAQRSTWDDVGVHLDAGPVRATFAAERVLRGEDLTDVVAVDGELVELPVHLASWEPAYRLPTYSEAGCDVGVPGGFRPTERLESGLSESGGDLAGARALDTTLAHHRADETVVSTSAAEGAADLAISGAVAESGVDLTIATASWPDALGELAWWAATGPRRSGAAAGRVRTWWALAGVSGLLDDWPLSDAELGAALDDLDATRFARADRSTLFGLAIHDRVHDLSWAVELRRRPDAVGSTA